ncbi:MAG: hypothetical protein JRF31_12035 [Deltaproteobacteria bacterium]|nr:hypothetical protein [Deltaproteobacteria bacterium]MBW2321537.1 hypothetical protein [Deltaproteobacteria bacterium]
MKTKFNNIGLEVPCNSHGQAVYYLGPGRTSGPFIFINEKPPGIDASRGLKEKITDVYHLISNLSAKLAITLNRKYNPG